MDQAGERHNGERTSEIPQRRLPDSDELPPCHYAAFQTPTSYLHAASSPSGLLRAAFMSRRLLLLLAGRARRRCLVLYYFTHTKAVAYTCRRAISPTVLRTFVPHLFPR